MNVNFKIILRYFVKLGEDLGFELVIIQRTFIFIKNIVCIFKTLSFSC